jgi:hypothetical protein
MTRPKIDINAILDQAIILTEEDIEAERAEAIECQPFGPEEHKYVKDALRLRSVKELFVLSQGNDPFYFGTKGDWVKARWFGDYFNEFGYSVQRPAHIRRVHYRVFSIGGYLYVLNAGGNIVGREQYGNNDTHWSYLCQASKIARVLDVVDPLAIVDHRNEDARIYVPPRRWTAAPSVDWDTPLWELPTLNASELLPTELGFELPGLEVSGYGYERADRAVIAEVWFEKSTVDDVVDPICRELGMNYVSGAGFESHTAIVKLLFRMREYGKSGIVLYGSDFDHKGVCMPVAAARASQLYRQKFGITEELYFQPITLTREQVEDYDLPRSPTADPNRPTTELDALEALHPGELARIVRDAAAPFVDDELENQLADAEREAVTVTERAWEAATEDARTELEEIEDDAVAVYEKYRERLGKLADELNSELKTLQEKLNHLTGRVSGTAQTVEAELELPDRPEADGPDIGDELMYDSTRHWFEQLDAFKTWQQRHW